ncbi:hypothetical protein [Bowmanella pacifica]|uniref:TIGR02285 family protein n=1 Tax=Bowmanella pacifica TaxID=502051 RepID=A0A918DGD8_9ALTE|nr:hypothetical protein [Bowmanella pacifica]GGO64607.1 hypothetical protein GCM10010982_04440 [Bowmanella pacifica]
MRCAFFSLSAGLISSYLLGQDMTTEPHFIWAVNDAPPFHILQGKYQGQGFCDVLTQQLQDSLSGHHEVMYLPPARIAKLREQGAPLCFPCMIKRADTLDTTYSHATLYYEPHQLFTSPDAAAQLQAKHGRPISLTTLLQDPEFSFVRPLGRQYGEHLQPLLNNYADKDKRHIQLAGEAPTMTMLRLVTAKKLDYSLDYPVIGRYFELTTRLPLAYLPIAENRHSAIIGAVGCSNSEWGEKAIGRINEALPSVLRSAAYLHNLEFWFADASPEFWHQYQRRVLSQSPEQQIKISN